MVLTSWSSDRAVPKRGARSALISFALGGLCASTLAAAAAGAPGDVTVSQVANINPGAASSSPNGLANFNGTMFFSANDGTNGVELWRSNGGPLGPGGTEMVANINPAGGSSDPNFLTNVNGTLFFRADDGTNGVELWRSNGGPLGPGGTEMVANINPAGGSSLPEQFTNVNGTLFFRADDGTNGTELWKSDGTTTTMVADINPTGSSLPLLTNINGTLFFSANDGTNGRELWKSNGGPLGPGGTEMVANINPAAASSDPSSLTNVNGTVFFSADDGTSGPELWRSNGGPLGPGGTEMVANIKPGAAGSVLQLLTNINSTLFFRADDGTAGTELWKSNGGPLGPGGTEMVANINPAAGSSLPSFLTDVNGTLFFRADDGTAGTELWRSNGGPLGPGGTEMVANINPAAGSSLPSFLTDVNGTLFFAANDGTNGTELWKSTGSGATMVADINPTGDSSPNGLTNFNGALFFRANDGTTGVELWKAMIEGAGPPGGGGGGGAAAPSNAFTIGKVKGKTVELTAPGPGKFVITDRSMKDSVCTCFSAAAAASRGNGAAAAAAKALLKLSSATASGAGPVTVPLVLTRPAKKKLRRRGKLTVNAAIAFTPTGGPARGQTANLKIKKK